MQAPNLTGVKDFTVDMDFNGDGIQDHMAVNFGTPDSQNTNTNDKTNQGANVSNNSSDSSKSSSQQSTQQGNNVNVAMTGDLQTILNTLEQLFTKLAEMIQNIALANATEQASLQDVAVVAPAPVPPSGNPNAVAEIQKNATSRGNVNA